MLRKTESGSCFPKGSLSQSSQIFTRFLCRYCAELVTIMFALTRPALTKNATETYDVLMSITFATRNSNRQYTRKHLNSWVRVRYQSTTNPETRACVSWRREFLSADCSLVFMRTVRAVFESTPQTSTNQQTAPHKLAVV